jgi:hypothetical protein
LGDIHGPFETDDDVNQRCLPAREAAAFHDAL